ncbi:hypothetical protein BKA81DRAFT_84424 [Phyllosticta paracitricarpa]|uniref:Uncharacterized protein n=1 Tax=Phyllosticta paracitricarpa TaxID=2016321 RepID=A0ABR1NK56_9PEZI
MTLGMDNSSPRAPVIADDCTQNIAVTEHGCSLDVAVMADGCSLGDGSFFPAPSVMGGLVLISGLDVWITPILIIGIIQTVHGPVAWSMHSHFFPLPNASHIYLSTPFPFFKRRHPELCAARCHESRQIFLYPEANWQDHGRRSSKGGRLRPLDSKKPSGPLLFLESRFQSCSQVSDSQVSLMYILFPI